MNMKKTLIAAGLTLATLMSAQASATVTLANAHDLIIDLDAISAQTGVATNGHDDWILTVGNGDADSKTGTFDDFTFGALWATSVYALDQNGLTGQFFDTNIPLELTTLGVTNAFNDLTPTGYTMAQAQFAADNGIPITDLVPEGSLRQGEEGNSNLDDLSPTTNTTFGASADDEGFGSTWNLTTEFFISGELDGDTPDYDAGFFKLVFNDIFGNSVDVLTAVFSDDSVVRNNDNTADVEMSFEITDVVSGFWNLVDENDELTDLASLIPDPQDDATGPMMDIAFVIDPATPAASDLVFGASGEWVARQSTLDGSGQLPKPVPAPAGLALLGLAALGLAGRRRFKA